MNDFAMFVGYVVLVMLAVDLLHNIIMGTWIRIKKFRKGNK